jgi:hypothetical protein
MKPVIFLPEAEEEMLEAASYYQSQADGLGNDYLSEAPDAWPILEHDLRRRLVRRFPFSVFYKIDPEEIVIIAVAHQRKKPGYWRKRINL